VHSADHHFTTQDKPTRWLMSNRFTLRCGQAQLTSRRPSGPHHAYKKSVALFRFGQRLAVAGIARTNTIASHWMRRAPAGET